jgi:hypothetical protein
MAGLSHDFAFRRHELPAVPKGGGPGRALPDSVLAVLVAATTSNIASGGDTINSHTTTVRETG